jgi:hypothetical protein
LLSKTILPLNKATTLILLSIQTRNACTGSTRIARLAGRKQSEQRNRDQNK